MVYSKQEVEPNYDSDPEASWSHWGIKRREASDDDNRSSDREERDARTGRRSVFGLGDERDGDGRAPDKEDELDEEVLYFDELEAIGEKEEVDENFAQGEERLEVEGDEEEEEEKVDEVVKRRCKKEEEEKEEKKALTVPRNCPFYMHDDRFGGRGRGRGMNFGRTNLWESKDGSKWRHDKFEEMMQQDSINKKFNIYAKVQRICDWHNQGCHESQSRGCDDKANQFKPIVNSNSQCLSSRTVRGRGPAKYKPLKSSNNVDPPGNKELPVLPANAEGLAPLYVTTSSGSYASSLGQDSSTGIASVGASASKLSKGSKPQDGIEVVDGHFGLQRIKPQRYSKMKFDRQNELIRSFVKKQIFSLSYKLQTPDSCLLLREAC